MTSAFLPQYLLVLEKPRHDLSSNRICANARTYSNHGSPSIIFTALLGLKFEENNWVIISFICYKIDNTRLIKSCKNSVSTTTSISQHKLLRL